MPLLLSAPMAESPLHFIQQNAQLFARVGSVVATYRTRGTARFGPYYRLIYRQDRRQRSLYIGRSEQLAAQVRELLHKLQEPRQLHIAIKRGKRLRKANLLRIKRQWQQAARAYGFRPHGWGVRGLRALGWPRIDKIHFRKKPRVQPSAPNSTNHPEPKQDHPEPPVTPRPNKPSPTASRTSRYCPNNDRAAQPFKPDRRPHSARPHPAPRYCPIHPCAAQRRTSIAPRGPPHLPGTAQSLTQPN